MNRHIEISGLSIYPVKALQGIDLQESSITPFGLEYDRRYMLTTSDGTFISQRSYPALATFSVAADASSLLISHASAGTITIPLSGPQHANSRAKIWNDDVAAFSGFEEADEYFSEALDEDIRLVWMPNASLRQADLEYSERGDRVSFADGYPVLLLGESSIADLNERLKSPVPMNRFRPNVVVRGSLAWEEDSWTRIDTKEASLRLVKPCARCAVTTTDQSTGETSKEPLATLATFRKRDSKVWVGMNCIPDADRMGVIRVGDIINAT